MVLSGNDVFIGLFALVTVSVFICLYIDMLDYKDKNKRLTEIAENYKKQRDSYKQDRRDAYDFIQNMGGVDSIVKQSRVQDAQFNKEEIDTLIRLCHPDKHNGKDSAKEITQKLLAMRSNNG